MSRAEKNTTTVKIADNVTFDLGPASGGTVPPSRIADASPGTAGDHHRGARRSESSKTSWQRERVNRLQRLFNHVEKRVANGSNVSRELRRIARRYAGRCYKSEPTKAIAFSEESLCRWFYVWRKAGRTSASLELSYKPAQERLPVEFGALLAGLVLETDALSMSQAIRAIQTSGMAGKDAPTVSTFLRKLTPPVRRELRGVIRKRFELRRAERRARKVLEGVTK